MYLADFDFIASWWCEIESFGHQEQSWNDVTNIFIFM